MGKGQYVKVLKSYYKMSHSADPDVPSAGEVWVKSLLNLWLLENCIGAYLSGSGEPLLNYIVWSQQGRSV